MIWLSPAFPVGGFAYSHGLEWAHEAGDLRDAATLEAWIADILRFGAGRNDLILLAAAYRATAEWNASELAGVAELALALATSAERRLETTTQGDAFVAAISRSWPCQATELLTTSWRDPVAYPVAVAVAAAAHAIPATEALRAFGLAFISNLVSAAVRLGVVGQTDGQRVIAALLPIVEEVAAIAESGSLDELGACAFRSDLAALRHEGQYTRLFRS